MYLTCPRGLTCVDHGMGWLGLTSGGCGEEVREEEERGADLLACFFSGNITPS